MVKVPLERRAADIDLDGVTYSVQYEIARHRDGWFDLTLWYRGHSISDRCPCYSCDPHEDVAAPHGPSLLKQLLSKFQPGNP